MMKSCLKIVVYGITGSSHSVFQIATKPSYNCSQHLAYKFFILKSWVQMLFTRQAFFLGFLFRFRNVFTSYTSLNCDLCDHRSDCSWNHCSHVTAHYQAFDSPENSMKGFMNDVIYARLMAPMMSNLIPKIFTHCISHDGLYANLK